MEENNLPFPELLDEKILSKMIKESGGEKAIVPDVEIIELLNERLALLRQLIEDIRADIKKRKELGEVALAELEREMKELSVLLNDILPLGRFNLSDERLDTMNERRIHLEKSIARLNELKRNHKIETWRDIASLKKELFKLLPEYRQIVQLKKVIG